MSGKIVAIKSRLSGRLGLRVGSVLMLLIGVVMFAAHGVESVFEMPQIFGHHVQLQQRLMLAVRAGRIEEMESVAREGVKLMPTDATWQYNLACALAYRADKSAALVELERAIELGFRDVEAIKGDNDLKQLAGLPRFKELLKMAQELRDQPVAGKPVVAPTLVFMGNQAEIQASNTLWNFDAGCFQTLFNLSMAELRPLASYAPEYHGPAAALITQWFKDGSAVGNFGDMYMNRDGGHSKLTVTNFPGLTPVIFSAEARQFKVDVSLPNVLVDYPLLGNCSMAMTAGPLWRSLPRAIMTDPVQLAQATKLYLANQVWFYPAHRDFTPESGDLLPANAPYFVISRGSSFTDKPFMEAFAAAMAAMRPKVKQELVVRKMLTPTLQMLLRQAQKGVKEEADYFTRAAHPVVFDARDLDVERMVRLAHELELSNVPPPAALRVVKDMQAEPGVEYFDPRAEGLFDTPFCIARLARSTAMRRSMTLEASVPIKAGANFRWALLQGVADKVTIKPLNGAASRVEVTVVYHGRYRSLAADGVIDAIESSRVDIGCFVKVGSNWSAPSILSISWPTDETRVYDGDGRVLSVDYTNAEHRYADPVLTTPKNWQDLYLYDDQNRLLGWYRKRAVGEVERFTWRGHKVMESDVRERPVKACAVEYLPRHSGVVGMPPTLSCVDTPKTFTYVYANDADKRGSVKEGGTR